jgi:hypothetical protein
MFTRAVTVSGPGRNDLTVTNRRRNRKQDHRIDPPPLLTLRRVDKVADKLSRRRAGDKVPGVVGFLPLGEGAF